MVMAVHHCEYIKNHRVVCFEMIKVMNFMLCEFYLNGKKKRLERSKIKARETSLET